MLGGVRCIHLGCTKLAGLAKPSHDHIKQGTPLIDCCLRTTKASTSAWLAESQQTRTCTRILRRVVQCSTCCRSRDCA